MDSPSSPGLRRILSSALVLAAVLAVSIVTLQPPSPKSARAPAADFSAVRAIDTLHRVYGKDVPHPVGSAADDEVRAHIIAELTQLGYQPEVQSGFGCWDFGVCAPVNNVVARLDGTESGDGVLLAAHYDSVAAGPGYSDDGTGVASVLEIARALKSRPQPTHSIIFLLDEGEEAGLLGARVFVDSHPWAKQVRAAVNLDARGTSGPSLLFETGSASDWAIQLFAQHAPRPITTSVAYELYKLLPNDTDFTVFKEAGYQGLNFAYLDHVALYHTPLDNSANVDLASLQHHGENALPSLLALANADLTNPPRKEAAFFSVFGHWLIYWPANRSLPYALGVFVLLLAELAWMSHKKRFTFGDVIWGLAGWLMTMAVTLAIALVASTIIQLLGGTAVTWVAHPLPLEIAFWSLAIAVVVMNAIFFAGRSTFWGVWAGLWIWWTLVSIGTSIWMPGVSYLFLVPASAAAILALPFVLLRDDAFGAGAAITILPFAVAAIVAFAPVVLLYDVIGNPALIPISLAVALLVTPLMPLGRDLRSLTGFRGVIIVWTPVIATGLAMFAAIIVSPFSAKSPERMNFSYWQDSDSGASQWIVEPRSGRLPEPVRLAADFHRSEQGAFPWDRQIAFLTGAPHLTLAAPTFTILESSVDGGHQHYRALLRSERGAPRTAALFPPDANVDAVRMNDQPLHETPAAKSALYNGWSVYSCPATPATGVEISFTLPVGKPVMVSVADENFALPEEGDFLLKARPLTATASQDGDITIVTRRVQLLP